MECKPEWEDEVSHANKGKVGAPYRYPGTLIMLAVALKVGLGVRYRQLEGTIGKMIGESWTPFFSQIRKRMGKLDVSTNRGGMITVSDPKHSRILAADATGLKQHDKGERMGKKWRMKRGFGGTSSRRYGSRWPCTTSGGTNRWPVIWRGTCHI